MTALPAAGVTDFAPVLTAGCAWLCHGPQPAGRSLPGLWVGEAGVGLALLQAGQRLGDAALIAAPTARAQWVATQPFSAPGVMHGTAGRLYLQLRLWEATGAPDQLQAAYTAGKHLCATAVTVARDQCYWLLPSDFGGGTRSGYGQGAAGIAAGLLDLYAVTGVALFRRVAGAAARWLAQLARPAQADSRAWVWPMGPDQPPGPPGWEHGAACIGYFFHHAARLDLVPGAADLAAGAVRTAAWGGCWASAAADAGLVGDIEFLLDRGQTGDTATHRTEAYVLGRLLMTFLPPPTEAALTPTGSGSSRNRPLSWAAMAQIIPCLLRVADPTRATSGPLTPQALRTAP